MALLWLRDDNLPRRVAACRRPSLLRWPRPGTTHPDAASDDSDTPRPAPSLPAGAAAITEPAPGNNR